MALSWGRAYSSSACARVLCASPYLTLRAWPSPCTQAHSVLTFPVVAFGFLSVLDIINIIKGAYCFASRGTFYSQRNRFAWVDRQSLVSCTFSVVSRFLLSQYVLQGYARMSFYLNASPGANVCARVHMTSKDRSMVYLQPAAVF